jgi:hypothetical protein
MKCLRWIPLLMIASSAGCNATANRIRPKAASALKCPEKEISVRPVNRSHLQTMHDDIAQTPEHQIAKGCGKSAVFVEQCPQDAHKGSIKCNWVALGKLKTDSLLRRASFDFGCAAARLELTWLDRSTTGIKGCGKRATYVLNCPDETGLWSSSCTWVLNTDAMSQLSGTPPAAKAQAAAAPPPTAAPVEPPAPVAPPSPPAAASPGSEGTTPPSTP